MPEKPIIYTKSILSEKKRICKGLFGEKGRLRQGGKGVIIRGKSGSAPKGQEGGNPWENRRKSRFGGYYPGTFVAWFVFRLPIN